MSQNSEILSDLTGHRPAKPAAPEAQPVRHDEVARLRDVLIGRGDVMALAETFRLLGDGTRVRILDALWKAELCVFELAALLDLSESAVSHQLRLLRSMRLVRSRREGRLVFYALDDLHIMELFQQGLGHIREPRATGTVPPVVGRTAGPALSAAGVAPPPGDEEREESAGPRGKPE